MTRRRVIKMNPNDVLAIAMYVLGQRASAWEPFDVDETVTFKALSPIARGTLDFLVWNATTTTMYNLEIPQTQQIDAGDMLYVNNITFYDTPSIGDPMYVEFGVRI